MNSCDPPQLKLLCDSSTRKDDGYTAVVQLDHYQGVGAKIRCSVAKVGHNDLHNYQLKSADSRGYREQIVSSANQWCARFDQLQVNESSCQPKKRKYDESIGQQMDFSEIVFKFQAVDASSGDLHLCEPLFVQFSPTEESAAVGEFITCSSRSSALVTGTEEMMLFIRPVDEGDILVRFYQLDSNQTEVWSAFVDSADLYVHHNCGIKFRIPPYVDVNVKEPVQVNYEVIYGHRKSEPKTFTYLPKPKEEVPLPSNATCNSGAPVGPNISLTTRFVLSVNGQSSQLTSQLRDAFTVQRDTCALKKIMDMRWGDDNNILHLTLIRRQIMSFRAILNQIRTSGCIQGYIDERNSFNQTPLVLAVLHQLPEAVHWLMTAGADPNVADSQGNAVLHLAVSEVRWFYCLRTMLLTKGPVPLRIDQLNSRGQTALHVAVNACNEMATRCLLESGANLRLKEGSQGQTCLHISVVRRSYELTELLLAQRDLDVKATRFDGRTALDLAEALKYHEIAQLIRRRYREINL